MDTHPGVVRRNRQHHLDFAQWHFHAPRPRRSFPITSYPGSQAVTYSQTMMGQGNGAGPGASCSMNATDTLTLTVTGTWNGPGAAPTTVPVLETSYAGYTASGQPGSQLVLSQSADDGLGDPVVPDGRPNGGVSQGSHLTTVPVQGGSWSFTRTLKAVSNCSQTMPPTAGSLSASVSIGNYTAQIDTRAVMISCPAVDASQYRDPPLTGNIIVNKRGSDGTLRGDTVNYPDFGNGGTIISYTASAPGNWAAGSDYHWNSALTGRSATGLWPNIAAFQVPEPFGSGVSPTDHIFISLYDAASRAEATGNYNIFFHSPYEPVSWPEDSAYPRKQTTQADPDIPGWPTYSYHAEVNPNTHIIDSITGPASVASVFPYGGTEAQSWHIDGGLGIPVEPVDVHFGGGYDKDIVNTFAGSSPGIPVALVRGKKTWAVYRQDIKRHKGHLDIYGVHGYVSTGVWCRDENVGIEHGVYYPYADAATENAHDPDPNWLPGY